MIRAATHEDAAAVAALWSALIRDTSVTFNTVAKTEADVLTIFDERAQQDLPFFVALHDGTVQGFASYAPFRSGPGYARTMEHSIMLDASARGKGLGRKLMQALETHARERGVHTLWAGVSGENRAGITFHQHVGFEEIATLPEVGFKFGRWMDLTLLCKHL